ncbi:unnamed protein product [Dracunculus medinensis]|uniref:Uncharacterized protein n=1 Tax=Dracunculus medinensis TaxID=318479 RepID=A0A0N4UDA8_DRAME|nr:unnamed protein product [Dracunculus medinensis]
MKRRLVPSSQSKLSKLHINSREEYEKYKEGFPADVKVLVCLTLTFKSFAAEPLFCYQTIAAILEETLTLFE